METPVRDSSLPHPTPLRGRPRGAGGGRVGFPDGCISIADIEYRMFIYIHIYIYVCICMLLYVFLSLSVSLSLCLSLYLYIYI